MTEALDHAAARFNLAATVVAAARAARDACAAAWRARDENGFAVSAKVFAAFEDAGINESHLHGSTGYGYNDGGRERYEALLAALMNAPAALARLQFVSGTHAIVAALSALLRDGDTLCSLTGRPYDTLRLAMVDHPNSLVNTGVKYFETEWHAGPQPSESDVRASLDKLPAVVFVQRSRGYAPRPSLSIAKIRELIASVRSRSPGSIVVVDNCYGEFVEVEEPGSAGADVIVGSLIKNPGGGLASTGAYIAGRADLIARIAERFFAPGLSTQIGPTLDLTRWLFAGLHRAPKAVAESLKIMDFSAALFSRLGYAVDPPAGAERSDIIQAVRLGSEKKLVAFVRGMQKLLPVNSGATPEPGFVPGYSEPVIMASGAFVSGSTMELSCDAPLRPPFEVYVQGGVDLAHGMLALMSAATAVGA